jgi:hypothetical protein
MQGQGFLRVLAVLIHAIALAVRSTSGIAKMEEVTAGDQGLAEESGRQMCVPAAIHG